MDYSQLALTEKVTEVISALEKNGITSEFVENAKAAKERVLSLIPDGSEVLTMTSVTLEQTGIAEAINTSPDYTSIRNKLNALDREKDSLEMQKLGSAPEWVIGSVHAVTEEGHILIASNTGSQLPAYSYGSAHVIWVVSTKKIVANFEDGMKRINEYIVPQETERGKKAYSYPDFKTNVSKLLLVSRETTPNRIHIIFVNEALGF